MSIPLQLSIYADLSIDLLVPKLVLHAALQKSVRPPMVSLIILCCIGIPQASWCSSGRASWLRQWYNPSTSLLVLTAIRYTVHVAGVLVTRWSRSPKCSRIVDSVVGWCRAPSGRKTSTGSVSRDGKARWGASWWTCGSYLTYSATPTPPMPWWSNIVLPHTPLDRVVVRSVLTKYVAMLRDYHVFSGHLSNLVFICDIFDEWVHSLDRRLHGRVSRPPPNTGVACGESLPLRMLTSTCWWHLWLMSTSFINYIKGMTLFNVFCRDLREGGGMLVERRIFLIPLLPKRVWLNPTCRPKLTAAAFFPGDLVSTSSYNMYRLESASVLGFPVPLEEPST